MAVHLSGKQFRKKQQLRKKMRHEITYTVVLADFSLLLILVLIKIDNYGR